MKECSCQNPQNIANRQEAAGYTYGYVQTIRSERDKAESRVAQLEAGIQALADEWEHYECECESETTGPYCLHRNGPRDFGKSVRALLTPTDKDGQ